MPEPVPMPPVERLWFRLDDVLPLAEHAVACRRHTLTAAALTAGQGNRPALILRGDITGDILTSNGTPGWHDKTGAIHGARACTWLHRPTRQYGRSAPLGAPRDGYLPLLALPGATGNVIDWLMAESGGRHWLAIDLPGTDEVLIDFEQLSLHDSRLDVFPPRARWVPAAVACVPMIGGGSYPALVAPDFSNGVGGELARFDRPTITAMIADLANRRNTSRAGEGVALRWRGDVLFVSDVVDDVDRIRHRLMDTVVPDPGGLYPLGAYTWPWLTTATTA